jgi:hypothetical protein
MSITAPAYSAATGTHVFTARNAAGQWWNGTAFVDYNAANIATYAIAAVVKGNGNFRGTLPDDTAEYSLHLRAGAALIADDPVMDVREVQAAVSGGVGALTPEQEAKIDEIIAMLQSDAPTSGGAQQYMTRTIINGDTYGGGGRPFLVTRNRSASWPLDLSQWDWSITFVQHPENQNAGVTLTGTVAVSVATGDARCLEVTLTLNDLTVALGRHAYHVRGANGSDRWSVELGIADVLAG